ncbi:hypothetical protein ACFYL6_04130 [Micromonospora sp. NPDC007208]|uniref:hypothetical protein n=1 Tax=Micromonospora sp. NPDC007208 TaxID=3364236 RepID=UPI0036A7B4F1
MKIVETPDGGARVWRLSIDSGGWHEKNELFVEITLDIGGDVFRRTAEDFVQEVERFRAHYLEGEGPIFALYETVQAVRDVAKAEDRHLTPKEQALIRGIRQRTFVMFEEQLRAAGDPGADPDIARVA